MPNRLHKGADFIYTFFLCWITGVYLHEWSHALVGQALGYEVSVSFPNPWAGWATFPQWQSIPFIHVVLIALAGGLGVSLLFILWAHFTSDWEHDLALYYFASLHGIYAVFEVGYILHYIPITILGIVPPLIALVPLVWILMRR